MGDMKEEYIDRFKRLHPVIQADSHLLEKVKSCFDHLQHSPYVIIEEGLLEGVSILGQGKSTRVYQVGEVVDPQTKQSISLALRLSSRGNWFHTTALQMQLHAFEEKFQYGRDVPFFVGPVLYRGEHGKDYGVLTEDVSCNKRLELIEDQFDTEYFTRKNTDGSTTRYFLDPEFPMETRLGEPYFEGNLIIQI